MDAKLFKKIVARVIEPKLSALGYEMNLNPPGYDFEGDIYFEKWLQEGIHIVINFQPSFPEINKIIRFTVILARNHPSYEFIKKDNIYLNIFRGTLSHLGCGLKIVIILNGKLSIGGIFEMRRNLRQLVLMYWINCCNMVYLI